MAENLKETVSKITAEQLSTYVVCPEAWRLKYLEKKLENKTEALNAKLNTKEAEVKKEWFQNQEQSFYLRKYAKLVYLLLVTLTIVVFFLDSKKFKFIKNGIKNNIEDTQQIPFELAALLFLLGLLIFIWDLFDRKMKKINLNQCLSEKVDVLTIKGSKQIESTLLSNDFLESRPDALITEDKKIIPVDINPSTLKLRDRHKIRMYLHFKLMQDKTPPYGIIIIGKEKKRHKIENLPEKQIWLKSLISEIESIKSGIPSMPTPSKGKCANCDVNKYCTFKIQGKK